MTNYIINKVFLFFVLFGLFRNCYSQKIDSKLTFVYWMPYDNNLSSWADSIYHMIQSGIESNDIIVTIQKDVIGQTGMTRSIITKKGITNYEISDEKSWSGKSYENYLSWVNDQINSDDYVIVFLNHGGKLDEIGLDEFPIKKYLRIDSARIAIENFNRLSGKKTELVFFQVCTKGSIEAIYEFKDIVNFTMFSQTILGAPNFYYTPFFKLLSKMEISKLDGLSLAIMITDNEREDMYYSLVCIDNSRFIFFEKELTNFLSKHEFLNEYKINNNLPLYYNGQSYWDFVAFIKSLKGIPSKKLLRAIEELIVLNKINSKYENMKGYSGLSILAMNKNYLEQIEKYKHLNFFKSFDTKNLYQKSLILMKK